MRNSECAITLASGAPEPCQRENPAHPQEVSPPLVSSSQLDPLNRAISLNLEASISTHNSSSCCLAGVCPRHCFPASWPYSRASFRRVSSRAGNVSNLARAFVQRPQLIHGKLNVAFESAWRSNRVRYGHSSCEASALMQTNDARRKGNIKESLHIARTAQNVMQHARRVSPRYPTQRNP